MELSGSGDPLYKLFRHPQSKLVVSRFRSLAGEKKLSEWQVFSILVTGFLNYWAIKADNLTINIDFQKSHNFDFVYDKINIVITLEGLVGNSHLQGPDFSLPQYESPYEFCRLVNKKAYDSRTTYLGIHGKQYHKANFLSVLQPAAEMPILQWEGAVTIYDKAFFHANNYATTLTFLHDDLSRIVREAVVKRFTQFSPLYEFVFRPLHARGS